MKTYKFLHALWVVLMVVEAIFYSIPARYLANLWGLMYKFPVPRRLRKPFYAWWARRYGARPQEAEKPMEEYPNLNEFFIRNLKQGLRKIERADLVMPVDGSIISHGIVTAVPQDQERPAREEEEEVEGETVGWPGKDFIIQETMPKADDKHAWDMGARAINNMTLIKGIPYRIQDLLGVPPPEPRRGHELHLYCLFLPASEYHHFHSPADWTITHRIRLPGHVLPLLPSNTRRFPHMLWNNERVSLLGRWKHGFFGFCAIAATAMVGKMRLVHDPELRTNQAYGITESVQYILGVQPPHAETQLVARPYGLRTYGVEPFGGEKGATSTKGLHVRRFDPAVEVRAGEELGYFEVGSGIAMVFEAPIGFEFTIDALTPGHQFWIGQKLSAA